MRLPMHRFLWIAILATILIPSLWSDTARAEEVHLLLVRDADYAGRCTRCIPGRLYGIPAGVDPDGAQWQAWALEPIADTLELGYEDNAPHRSSIPTGTYAAFVRTEATKKWMRDSDGKVLVDRAWRLELKDVPGGRTFIQFHYGKDAGWSEGCIILGKNASSVCQDECVFSDSPESAVAALRRYVMSRAKSSADPITVRIVDHDRLP